MTFTNASQLSNAQLTIEVSRLAAGEREATVALIVHLAEFDARRLYEPAGYSSLFKYCMAVLRLSEDAVYNRIEAARAARRYPVIADMLVSGALSPTTVRLLARHLTSDNHAELLTAASEKGKQAVEELLACRFPQPDVAACVRKLPTRPVAFVAGEEPTGKSGPTTCPARPEAVVTACPGIAVPMMTGPALPAPVGIVRPLAPERYEIRFTATAATREKLRLAQDLLGHALPSGDIAEVFDRALTLLVADLERRKFAATPRPRPSRGPSESSDTIPAEVRRAVAARDQGRCAFVAASGHRCGERRFVEFHHLVPRATGGRATVDKIQLRCRAHNGYEVDLFFGPGVRHARTDSVRETSATYGSVARGGTRSGTGTSVGAG